MAKPKDETDAGLYGDEPFADPAMDEPAEDDTIDFPGGEEDEPTDAGKAADPGTPKPRRTRKPKAEPVADPELGPHVHPEPTVPAKLDETVPGGRFVVNGRPCDCNGKPIAE
jgi:hypothetical protein